MCSKSERWDSKYGPITTVSVLDKFKNELQYVIQGSRYVNYVYWSYRNEQMSILCYKNAQINTEVTKEHWSWTLILSTVCTFWFLHTFTRPSNRPSVICYCVHIPPSLVPTTHLLYPSEMFQKYNDFRKIVEMWLQ